MGALIKNKLKIDSNADTIIQFYLIQIEIAPLRWYFNTK